MPQTLPQYLKTWQRFDWATSNCAHFALGFAAPHALRGVHMPGNAAGLRATLRALGARSLREAVTQRVGAEIPPAQAQSGDVVLWGNTLGLCIGRHMALPMSDGAVVFLPMAEANAAWRAVRGGAA